MMSPERWRHVQSLYNAAIEMDPGNRAAFVAQACKADDELRREVVSLLAQDASADGRLDHPAWQDEGLRSRTITTSQVSAGTQLGPYRIESMIGAGGMGQVYRARDTRLDRSVAIKVLSEKFSDRFQREARAISSLNHPNICTLHDVGPDYLVMELLEGETLSSKLKSGPLPLDLAIRYGVQVAGALAAAHAKGVIHGDLKPGNIMVTKPVAKVLDFGLARFAGDPRLSSSKAVMGTPAYMAPEQWTGGECNERTDIFALGLALYEMATGIRAESSANPVESMKGLPERFVHVVQRCLEREPEDRWQSARDVKAELEWAAKSRDARPIRDGKSSRRLAAFAVVTGMLAIAGAFLLGRGLVRPAEQVYSASISLPAGTTLSEVSRRRLSLSPDGQRLAIATSERLFLRSLGHDALQSLPGTQGGSAAFWSPDGNHLGFFARNEVKRIDRSGGPAITLARADYFDGGTWNRDGVILFGAGSFLPLQRVSASGGTLTPVTTLNREAGESRHTSPFFLPDGHHFIYSVLGTKTGGPFDANGIYAASLSSPHPKLILAGGANAQYSQGYLLFVRERALMAQRFDLSRLELQGEAKLVAAIIDTDLKTGHPGGAFAVSQSGALVYQTDQSLPPSQLHWFDRSGKQAGSIGEALRYRSPTLSPDGKRAGVTITDLLTGTTDIWIIDLARGSRTRFTSDAKDARAFVWSPDGNRIVFRAVRDGRSDLFQKATDRPGEAEVLWSDDLSKYPVSWSQDGRFILYSTGVASPDTGGDVWVLPMSDRKAFPFLKSKSREMLGHFSPDGRWVAYASNESGQFEVFVVPFPGPGPKTRITEGSALRWRLDGREAYYTKGNQMMALSVDGRGQSFRAGAETPLFRMPPRTRGWDVSGDGKKFLINVIPEEITEQPAITLVVNWPALLTTER